MMSLDPMLKSRSVAVVGASDRPGSVGDQTIRQLMSGGFTGEVFPVNPRYETVHGLTAWPSLAALDRPVDLVVLAVANEHLEAGMEESVRIGARSVVIFASCVGEAADGHPLRDRLRALAAEGGIPICGGNGMGFLNVEGRLRICGFYQPPDLRPGGVTFISHSGSLFSALLHNRRAISFNLVVSTGLEINTSMDAYMRWALALDTTRVLALFLETIRDPVGFRDALAEAEQREVPVIALKVGASGRGREAVATHSEGLAGEDAVYEALFEAHGVHRVESMDEMLDTIDLFAAGRRATAPGLGAVHDSGGERALLIDTAERIGVPLPTVGPEATSRLADLLDPGLEPANPVDAWGTGRDAEAVFAECLSVLADDDAIGAVAFSVDLTTEEKAEDSYANAVLAAAKKTIKPVTVLANLASAVDPVQARSLREGGVPVLEGTETGLRALGHLLDHHQIGTRPALADRLSSRSQPKSDSGSEAEALTTLAGYGIPVPNFDVVADESALLRAAAGIGFPVVVKTAEPIDHKTEVGAVVVGIAHQEHLMSVYRDLAERIGPSVMVAEQITGEVELGLGMITDDQFGPIVLVLAGGTLIELLDDRVALLPRVDEYRAGAALDRLRIRPLLDGARGAAAADIASIARLIARFSELAIDGAGVIDSIDVNPVICGPGGAVAVDALFKAR